MEEKIQEKKRSKTFLLLLIIILIGLGFFYYKFYLIKDINKEEKAEKVEPPTSNDLNALYHDYERCDYDSLMESEQYIFLNDEVIYECQSSGEYGCYATTIDDFEYCNKTDSLILITDNHKEFLYDYKNQNVIFEADAFTSALYNDGNFAYFVFYKNDKAGLVSMTGNVILEPKYDNVTLATANYEGEFSLKHNVVAVKDNGKVGVVEFTTGDVKVPLEYDNIRIFENYYILIKDNKAILVDSELNTILDDEYDDMVIYNGVLFAEKNKELTLYDLSGNKLVDESIKINKPYTEYSDTGYTAYSMDQYNKIMTIEVFGEGKWEYDSCYNLNIYSKKLEKVACDEITDYLSE